MSWLQLADGIAPAQALEINTISMTLVLPVMLAAGWASDRYGRKPLLFAATVLGFFCALPLFWLMHQPATILAGEIGFVLITGVYFGIHPTVLVEAAPPQGRCTVVALGYNLCLALIGGSTPLAATWLVERTGNELSPASVIMGRCGGHLPRGAARERNLSQAARGNGSRASLRGEGAIPAAEILAYRHESHCG